MPPRAALCPPPTITRATPADIPQIVELDRLAMGRHYQVEPEEVAFVLAHGAIFLIRTDAGELIGELQLTLREDSKEKLSLRPDEAHCASIAIHPEWQQRRLAKLLLAGQTAYALAQGCQRIALTCRVENYASLALWFRTDARIVGYDPTYYGPRADGGARLILRQELASQRNRPLQELTSKRIVMVNFASVRIDFRAHEQIASLLHEGYIGYQASYNAGIFFGR